MISASVRRLTVLIIGFGQCVATAQTTPTFNELDKHQLIGHYSIHLDKSTPTHVSTHKYFRCERLTSKKLNAFKQCRVDDPGVYLCNSTIRNTKQLLEETDPDYIVVDTLKACKLVLEAFSNH